MLNSTSIQHLVSDGLSVHVYVRCEMLRGYTEIGQTLLINAIPKNSCHKLTHVKVGCLVKDITIIYTTFGLDGGTWNPSPPLHIYGGMWLIPARGRQDITTSLATDIRGYDLGDQEVIDIQASQGVSISIVDGRRGEVGKLSISLNATHCKMCG